MTVKCPEIISVISFLKDHGNFVLSETKGWNKVRLDMNMSKPLDVALKDKIISSSAGLKYWEYGGSPHNAAGNGFLCEKHEISISFPLKSKT